MHAQLAGTAATSLSSSEQVAGSLKEDHALLLRLKELRRRGQHDEARTLARFLELLDQSDDWSMRYSS